MECPDLETLLMAQADGSGDCQAHVAACPSCAALLEEHRLLEKDLFRLFDPNPPADLVAKVMSRVQAEPPPFRVEMRVGISILAAAVMAAVLSFVATHGPIGLLGATAARALVSWKTVFFGLNNAVQVAWSTTTIPLAVSTSLVLFVSLVGLRRVAPTRTVEIEVVR
jgi:anti-sigma factor RsiW